jgi:hypothetical protein
MNLFNILLILFLFNKLIISIELNNRCDWKPTDIDTFYINLDASTYRNEYMLSTFKNANFNSYHRVSAIFPSSSSYNITKLEQPCKRNTPYDLSVILSHLTAIYKSIYSNSNNNNRDKFNLKDYSLILEDDVQFIFDIDYYQLINSVPDKNFGIF